MKDSNKKISHSLAILLVLALVFTYFPFIGSSIAFADDGKASDLYDLDETADDDASLTAAASTEAESSDDILSAAAAAEYGLYVGGVEVTSSNASNIPCTVSGSASYDPASRKLTLNNATISRSGFVYMSVSSKKSVFPVAVIGSSDSLTIELIGNNHIKDVVNPSSLPSDADTYDSYAWRSGYDNCGICTKSNLEFTGSGSLEIDGSAFTAGIKGIGSSNSMTVSSGSSVRIAMRKKGPTYGIDDMSGMTIAGDLTVNNPSGDFGIWTKKLIIKSSGSVTARSKKALIIESLKMYDKVVMKAGSSSKKAYYVSSCPESASYVTAKKGLGITINPASIKTLARSKKSFTAKWVSQSGNYADGYQLRYSLKSSMKKASTITVKGANVSSLKVKKLKSNKKYYVQLRTYKTVRGAKKYSAWSSKKTVKTK